MGAGFFHSAHSAMEDCHALLEILTLEMPKTGQSALKIMLDAARRPTVRVWAVNSPYELRIDLKKRGYRWNDGSDGRVRSWFVDVPEAMLDPEIEYLRRNIYLHDVDVVTERVTAMSRFSTRA